MSFRLLIGLYKVAMGSHTYKLQAMQTGMVFAAGNLVTQWLTKDPEEPYDFGRTTSIGILGIALGPVTHKWYKLLDDLIGRRTTFRTVAKKMLADQMVMAPLLIAWFIGGSAMLSGEDLFDGEMMTDIKHEHSDKIVEGYKVWPFVQVVTFVLPINFRVLFQQATLQALFTYSSYKNKRLVKETKRKVT